MKLIFLPRSLDFTVALLQRLVADPGQEMEKLLEESYNITLKPWHGWISSAAYKVLIWALLLSFFVSQNLNTAAVTYGIHVSYELLKPILNWQINNVLQVALKLVPDSKTLINLLMPEDETYDTLKEDVQTLISLLVPFLEEIHSVLVSHQIDVSWPLYKVSLLCFCLLRSFLFFHVGDIVRAG